MTIVNTNDAIPQPDPCRNGHLPRFPVSFVNQMRGFDYECAYCGIGLREPTASKEKRGPDA